MKHDIRLTLEQLLYEIAPFTEVDISNNINDGH